MFSPLLCLLFCPQAGFLGGFVLLFGNEMLLTSYFASCLLTIWVRLLWVRLAFGAWLCFVPSFIAFQVCSLCRVHLGVF